MTPAAAAAARTPRRRSEITRARVLECALDLFRRQGYEATSMREIASAAGLSLGASYYYFPHKEAIVEAYYETVQQQHQTRLHDAIREGADLRTRLGLAMHTKLDIIERDRKLLGGLFRFVGEPGHRLSAFGAGTSKHRDQSMAVFEGAIGDERLPADVRDVLPAALWLLHMGLILYFVHDGSPQHQRTRRLTDGVMDLVARLVSISSLAILQPVLKPIRSRVMKLIREADLLPSRSTP